MARKPDDKNLVNLGPSDDSDQEQGTSRIQSKPQRRVFSAAYKLEILEKLQEAKSRRGAVGELLRREGLYAAQVAYSKGNLGYATIINHFWDKAKLLIPRLRNLQPIYG
ncbi:MAG: hypothetical protein ACOH5I_10995 [Oligoflexus sp.]